MTHRPHGQVPFSAAPTSGGGFRLDPVKIHPNDLPDTASSPRSDLTAAELGRYLDYCSEMVSLISKLAALYAERLDDAELLQAVDEVEDLTNGIAGRVWQKISLIGPK